jgi:hypothetical protein
MNLYPGRIQEVHRFLETVWGVRDTQAIDLLLASLLPEFVTRLRHPWYVLETDWNLRDCFGAWFTFGGAGADPQALAKARILRYQSREDCIAAWMERWYGGCPNLFVEAEWRGALRSPVSYASRDITQGYMQLLGCCLRLRTIYPRTGMHYLQPIDEQHANILELDRLTRRVLDNNWRSPPAEVPAVKSLPYWCELLQRIAPAQTNWEALTGNLLAAAWSIPALYADGRPPDWRAAERLIRDSVPWMTRWVIEQVASGEEKSMAAWQLLKRSGESLNHRHYIVTEIRRLRSYGILWAKEAERKRIGLVPWHFEIRRQEYLDLLDRNKPILV